MRAIFCAVFLAYLFYGGKCHEIVTVCKAPSIPASTDIHYVAIIDHAVGSFLLPAHDFLLQHVYCGLNEEKNANVKLDSWHLDSKLKTCTVFDSNDSIANIHGKIFETAHIIPPSPTMPSLCEKLEIAAKCAPLSISKNQKVEIAIPMLFHEELGKCELNKVLPFKDYKLTVFWTNDYYHPDDLLPQSNVDIVILNQGFDFLPTPTWKPDDLMVDALKNGKNEVAKSLGQRFSRLITTKPPTRILSTTLPSTTSFLPPAPTSTPTSNASWFKSKTDSGAVNSTAISPMTSRRKNNTFWNDANLMPVIAAENAGQKNRVLFGGERRRENESDSFDITSTTTAASLIKNNVYATTEESDQVFVFVGGIMGDPKNGKLWFIVFFVACIVAIFVAAFCTWCCCCREPVKGKYEVMEKETKPLSAEPDPEAGIAFSSEPLDSRTILVKKPAKTRTSKKQLRKSNIKKVNRRVRFEDDEEASNNDNAFFDSPIQGTPPNNSPIQITSLPSQHSQAPQRSVKFQATSHDDPRTLPSLKALSDDNLWSTATYRETQ